MPDSQPYYAPSISLCITICGGQLHYVKTIAGKVGGRGREGEGREGEGGRRERGRRERGRREGGRREGGRGREKGGREEGREGGRRGGRREVWEGCPCYVASGLIGGVPIGGSLHTIKASIYLYCNPNQ